MTPSPIAAAKQPYRVNVPAAIHFDGERYTITQPTTVLVTESELRMESRRDGDTIVTTVTMDMEIRR